MKVCEKCHAKTDDEAMFCPKCGSDELTAQNLDQSNNEANTPALLALIFGIIGCAVLLIFLISPGIILTIVAMLSGIAAIVCNRMAVKGKIAGKEKTFALIGKILGIITVCIVAVLWFIELIVAVSFANQYS